MYLNLVRKSAAILLLFAMFQSCAYSGKKATRLLEKAKEKKYEIIVVPGVPFNVPDWDRVMRGRVYWSKYLYDIGVTKNVMYSGSSVYSPYYEAKIMALYAEAIGIPKDRIFIETKAEHSTENIYYSFKLARKLGFNSVGLASDHFQTKSLKRFTRKRVSPNVGLIPWVMPIIRQMDPAMVTPQIPYNTALNDSFVSIKKREGFFKRLKGTWGKNLDKTLYN